MKRSEMIKFIASYFEDGEHFSAQEIAEDLLNNLENKGMLPPSYNLNRGSGMYKITSDYQNEWESE